MAALVQALGGTLDQQLSWMAAEGTNGGLVFAKVRQAPDDQLARVTEVTRKAIKKEIRRVSRCLGPNAPGTAEPAAYREVASALGPREAKV